MRRVLITGVGPVCGLGNSKKEFWDHLTAGRTSVRTLDRLKGAAVEFGAEAKGFELGGILGHRAKLYDRSAQMAIAAARAALLDAGLLAEEGPSRKPVLKTVNSDRIGTILGSSRGAAELLENSMFAFREEGVAGLGPRTSPLTTFGSLGALVAQSFALRGPCLTVSAACASSSHAIGAAFESVRRGKADLMLAGGSEACLTPFCMAMFFAAGIVSKRSEDPARACRPFDRDRDGTAIGEGAGIVVLESEEHARARGAGAYCELLGCGTTCDAYSLAGIAKGGEGLARAIAAALEDGGTGAESVDYVNAHGTGTKVGDAEETAAIKTALGAAARKAAVGSIKSMTGHTFGAAGGIGAIVCSLAIRDQLMPPNVNLDHPDPECDLDCFTGASRPGHVRVALSNAMGFGGNNVCLAFGCVCPSCSGKRAG